MQETNQSFCFHQHHTGHAGWEWNVTGSSLKLCMGVQLHQSLGKHSLVFPRATHTYMYKTMYKYKNQNQGFVHSSSKLTISSVIQSTYLGVQFTDQGFDA